MSAIRFPLFREQQDAFCVTVDPPIGNATTDTARIQAAIDGIDPAIGGAVQLQRGEYLCNALTFKPNVAVRGVGRTCRDPVVTIPTEFGGTILRSNLTGGQDFITTTVTTPNWQTHLIEDLTLVGSGSDGNGLVLNQPVLSSLSRIYTKGFGNSGFVLDGGLAYSLHDCCGLGNTFDGITFRKTAGTPANIVKLRGCTFNANLRDGLRLGDGSGPSDGPSNSELLVLDSCLFEHNDSGYGVNLLVTSGVCQVTGTGNWFEDNGLAHIRTSNNASATTRLLLQGTRWTGSAPRYALGTGSFVTEPGVRHGCELTRTTAFSLTSGVETGIDLTTEGYKTRSSLHSNSTNPSRITFSQEDSGLWLLQGWCGFAANSTGTRFANFIKNGATLVSGFDSVPTPSASAITYLNVSGVVDVIGGDYVELRARQSSGGPLDVVANPRVTATFLGPKAV